VQKLIKAVEQQGVSLIPLSLYFKDGYAKVELATGRGKKDYDKRHALAERQADREARRALSERTRGR
jgi:SsrA-binding protein